MGEQDPIWALGMMSGTSMDGIDGAALLTDGIEIRAFGPTRFEPYPEQTRSLIARGQGLWPGADPVLEQIAAEVEARHAQLAVQFPTVEVIGFHGQTLAHDPAGYRTFQAGDGARLARARSRTVAWDFRSADVLSGGEGAPLVPAFHHACARMLDLARPVVFLNIGGVANVTWVDPLAARPEARDALVAFDTGPGNALLDDLMAQRTGASLDAGGTVAGQGAVDEDILRKALEDPYFSRPAPKSLDRGHFHYLLDAVADLDLADAAATLTAFTAASIAAAIRHMPHLPESWMIAGGGRHNATLMKMLAARINAPVSPVEQVGLDGDFLEAQAFAFLAVRVLRSLPTSFPGTTGCRIPVCGGRISPP